MWLFHHLLVRKLWIDFYPKTFLQNHEPLLILIISNPNRSWTAATSSTSFNFYPSALLIYLRPTKISFVFRAHHRFFSDSMAISCILGQCYVHGKTGTFHTLTIWLGEIKLHVITVCWLSAVVLGTCHTYRSIHTVPYQPCHSILAGLINSLCNLLQSAAFIWCVYIYIYISLNLINPSS